MLETASRNEPPLSRLRDRQAVNRIIARLLAAEDGHLGDVRTVGNGVSEMRIHHGPGYRICFITRGTELIVRFVPVTRTASGETLNGPSAWRRSGGANV